MNSQIRILVVEDQYFFRLALHTVFGTRGDMTIVGEASNADQAVSLYRDLHPDVVIMDLGLPGVSGMEAVAEIREYDKKARILVLSHYEGSEDVFRAMRAGASAYLTKDASSEELMKAIVAVATGRQYLPAELGALLAARTHGNELTDRELEVLRLMAEGHSNREISGRLRIAEKTVKIHVSRILEKLEVGDRTQAAIAAMQRGFVHLD